MSDFEVRIPAEREITGKQLARLSEFGGTLDTGAPIHRAGVRVGREGGEDMRLSTLLIVPAVDADAARRIASDALEADASEADSWTVSRVRA